MTYLIASPKLYIDFSKDEEVEYNFDNLLRTLLNSPLFKKPKIGANPFNSIEDAKPDRTSDGVQEVMIAIAETYDNTGEYYITYLDLALQRDFGGAGAFLSMRTIGFKVSSLTILDNVKGKSGVEFWHRQDGL